MINSPFEKHKRLSGVYVFSKKKFNYPGEFNHWHTLVGRLVLSLVCFVVTLEPPQILTDSLSSVHLICGWGAKPPAQALGCSDRVEVWHFIHTAMALATLPIPEKVKAHD